MILQPGAEEARRRMVRQQIAARGVRSPQVLSAMAKVRREGYVPSYLGEFAYEDTPLPIEEEQTISQPYIVAYMVEALGLEGGERVLEIGTGSGYAAAVLGEIAGEVYTIERHASLARSAAERLRRDGYDHVHVRHGDGTLGWPEAAPFDGIVVAAGGPAVPLSLREQLAVGGRLVIPVGESVGLQRLTRVTRVAAERYEQEDLGGVRFVPLVGAEGWREAAGPPPVAVASAAARLVRQCAEPFDSIASIDLGGLLERIGDARVVLLGEATHGTSEFYRLRARITRELIERRGFDLVAAEADWPDAARIDAHVRGLEPPPADWKAFERFPQWMWRNQETAEFVDWLRDRTVSGAGARPVRFVGLDLYGMQRSIEVVLNHLERVDPPSAAVARERYGCLTPWQTDPAAYGRAALTGAYRSCEEDVVRVLRDHLAERMQLLRERDPLWFDTLQNARAVADAEAYYRVMYYGGAHSWNLRDRHMFATLRHTLDFLGPDSRAVVWAHNSHVGDASATSMSARGETNLGELCRQQYRDAAYAVGFGTDRGTVAAASHWGGPLEFKRVRPARADSYERLCLESGLPRFLLPLRRPREAELRRELTEPRLERAIGVIYRPETELASHYLQAVLPHQFDEYVWFEETTAVRPLA
jgi:protein-L-isoaspartate(D-aspartate) O-methyltransferase